MLFAKIDRATEIITTVAAPASQDSAAAAECAKAQCGSRHMHRVRSRRTLLVCDIGGGKHRVRTVNLDTAIIETYGGNGRSQLRARRRTRRGHR